MFTSRLREAYAERVSEVRKAEAERMDAEDEQFFCDVRAELALRGTVVRVSGWNSGQLAGTVLDSAIDRAAPPEDRIPKPAAKRRTRRVTGRSSTGRLASAGLLQTGDGFGPSRRVFGKIEPEDTGKALTYAERMEKLERQYTTALILVLDHAELLGKDTMQRLLTTVRFVHCKRIEAESTRSFWRRVSYTSWILYMVQRYRQDNVDTPAEDNEGESVVESADRERGRSWPTFRRLNLTRGWEVFCESANRPDPDAPRMFAADGSIVGRPMNPAKGVRWASEQGIRGAALLGLLPTGVAGWMLSGSKPGIPSDKPETVPETAPRAPIGFVPVPTTVLCVLPRHTQYQEFSEYRSRIWSTCEIA